MISYDQYENKIKKVAKFRSVIKRFKFLFIAIFALIIAAIATLLGLKGSFSGEIKIVSSVYGESYSDPEGVSAFMSSVSYEYARAGSEEWSAQKPVKAGKYNVRAVSDKTIGKGYGKIASFEIAPLEVSFSIGSDSVEYGGVPDSVSIDLLTGDSLDKNALLFVYDDYVSERTGVDLDETSIKIMNGADDRSSCYTVRHEKKELNITKRSIGVSLQAETFVYSGSAIAYSGIASDSTKSRLAVGDEIRISSVQLQQNGANIESAVLAGNYSAYAEEFRIYKGKIDVTSQYLPKSSAVSFTIQKRPVTVTTPSAHKEYDGTPLKVNENFKAAGFVAGDVFSVLDSTSQTDARANVKNEFTAFEIRNAAGTDLSGCYDIKWEYGTLTVAPRKMTVTSPGTETPWIYDGKPKIWNEVYSDDEYFKAVASSAQKTMVTTVGRYLNEVDFTIRNLTTGAVENKANFDITTQWGTLEIIRRDITITIDDAQKVYDGNALALLLIFSENKEKVRVTSGSLAEGDYLADGKVQGLTNVHTENGVVAGVLNESTYIVRASDGDRTENYNIQYVRGELTVTPRHITLVTNSRDFVFDGESHSDGGCTIYEDGVKTSLIKGNELTLQGSALAFVNVSETKSAIGNNICSYTIGANYAIDGVSYGTIKILPRSLTVTTNSAEFVYDGEPHSDGGYTATHDGGIGLIGEDKLTLSAPAASVTNVSESVSGNNVCTYHVPNENYVISGTLYGTLTIAPRTIRVVTDSAEKVYDGEPLSKNEYIKTYYIDKNGVEQAGLLGEDRLTLGASHSITNVRETAERNNVCTFTEPNNNYVIVGYDFGTLTITPIHITIRTASNTFVYDGAAHSESGRTVYLNGAEIRELIAGNTLTLESIPSFTDVAETRGKTENNACVYSVTDNYVIDRTDYGTVTILPRSLTVTTNTNATFIFDGEAHSDSGYTTAHGVEIGLIGDDKLTPQEVFKITNVWETAGQNNVCTYTVSDNYTIESYIYGTLTMNARSLTVTTATNTFVYNGKAQSDSGYTTAHGEEIGLIGNDKLNLQKEFSIINVWETAEGNNKCVYTVPNENYSIGDSDYIYGTLTVTARPIHVETDSATNVYDGTPLEKNEYVNTYYLHDGVAEAGLLGKDKLTLKTAYSIVNVRQTGDNLCTFNEPNLNYKIVGYNCGTLTITPRPLLVLTGSAEKVYDGAPLSKDDEPEETYYYGDPTKTKDGLIGSDQLIPKDRFSITNVRESKANNNVCTFSVPNDNYTIEDYEYGTLTVTKKPVTVQVSEVIADYGEVFVYPDEAGNFENKDSCGLVGEDKLKIGVTFDLTAYGYKAGDRIPVKEAPEGIPRISINVGADDSGTEMIYTVGGYEDAVRWSVTEFVVGDPENYDVSYESAPLYIRPRMLHIDMRDTATFYGEDVIYPTGIVEGKEVAYIHYTNFNTDWQKAGILSGDTMSVQEVRYLASPELNPDDDRHAGLGSAPIVPKNSGRYKIMPYEIQIALSDGRTETAKADEDWNGRDNYLPRFYFPGELNIMPRPIEVTLNEIETKMFDGELREYSAGGEKIVLGDGGEFADLLKTPDVLAYGEKLHVEVVFDIKPIDGYGTDRPLFAGVYPYFFDTLNSSVEADDGTTIYGGLKNYAISCMNDSAEITKRPVTIQMRDLDLIYGDAVRYDYDSGTLQIAYEVKSELGFVGGGEIFAILPDYGCGERPSVGEYEITAEVFGVNYPSVGRLINIVESYDITVLPGTLTITPKPVTVGVAQKSVQYGSDYSGFSDLQISALAYDEKLTLSLGYFADGKAVTPKNVGLYDVKITPVLSAGEEGLKNYTISYFNIGAELQEEIENALFVGGLEITKLPIKVTPQDSSTMYGEEIGTVKVDISPALPYDEILSWKIVYKKGDNIVTPKYADEYMIVIDELFVNGGKEGLTNYELTCDTETLTITPRPVEITVDPIAAKYGDSVQNVSGNYIFTAGSLAYGDQLFINVIFDLSGTSETRPDAGTYPISGEVEKILFNGNETVDGYKVAESYAVTVHGSDLTVEKRNIRLTLNSILQNAVYYDGTGHGYTAGNELIAGDGMAEGEELKVAVKFYSALDGTPVGAEIGKAGIYIYRFDPDGSSVENGGLKGIENYVIQSSAGSCEILQRTIKVTLHQFENMSYGTIVQYPTGAESYHKIETVLPAGGLVEEETFEFFAKFRNTETGTVYESGVILPVGDYEVFHPDSKNDFTVQGGKYADGNNYKVVYVTSSFTVTARRIVVTALDVAADYGEMPTYPMQNGNYAKIEGDGLVEGDNLTVRKVQIRFSERTPVGEYDGAVEAVVIHIERLADRTEVTANYTIETVNGKLTVEPREILVTTNTTSFVYDGESHSDGGYTIVYKKNPEGKALAYDDGHKLADSDLSRLPSVTEYSETPTENRFAVMIYNDTVAFDADNYIIDYDYGNLSITKLILYVSTGSDSKVYDGLPLNSKNELEECYYYPQNDAKNGKIDGLITGHLPKFKLITITDAGNRSNDNLEDIIDGTDVSKAFNYEIRYSAGRLIVDKREIYVTASSDIKVYDGKPLYSPDNDYTVMFYPDNDLTKTPIMGENSVLVFGHTFRKITPSVTDAGTVQNNPYAAVMQGATEVTKNYNIVCSATLQVTKRPVTYWVGDLLMTYCNAAPSENPKYTVQREGEVENEGLLQADESDFSFALAYRSADNLAVSRFNAGTYSIVFTYQNRSGKDNYEFRGMYGTLTIEQAKLTLRPANKRVPYMSADQVVSITAEDLIVKGLVEGDVIVNPGFSRTSLSASENKVSVSLKISLDDLVIRDKNNRNVDVLDNYEITAQTGAIGFTQRTVYVEQIIPDGISKTPTGRGQLSYTGEKQNIAGGEALFRVLSASELDTEEKRGNWDGLVSYKAETCGLLDGESVQFKGAYVPKSPQNYKQWVYLNVLNSQKKTSNFYKIVYVSRVGTENSIEVLHVSVKVDFSAKLTQAYLDGLSVGMTVLDASYLQNVEGILSNQRLEAAVNKNEDGTVSVCVFIYQPTYGSGGEIIKRSDRSSIYEVTATYASGIGPETKLVNMNNYPASEQGE